MISKTYSKALITSILAFSMIGVAAADVPNIQVTSQNLTTELAANQEHKIEFQFYNNDSEYKVVNFSLQESKHVNWEENHFNISAEETRTINATIYKRYRGSFNQTFRPKYYYPGADNSFDAPPIRFNVSTYYRNTSVSLEAFENSFTIDEFGDKATSVFKIDNTGNETGFNISVEGEGNISFDQSNGFELGPSNSKIVSFNVTVPAPEQNRTAGTNKTYNYDVSVSGENFETKKFAVEVFVPFKQYNTSVEGQTIAERWLELEKQRFEYCQSVDFESAVCKDEFTVVKNNTKYVNQTPESNLTLTEPEIRALKQLSETTGVGFDQIVERVKKLQNTVRYQQKQAMNNFTEVSEKQNKQIQENSEMIQGLNQTVRQALDQEQREDSNRSFWSTVRGIFIVLIVLSVGGWKSLKIRAKRNNDSRA